MGTSQVDFITSGVEEKDEKEEEVYELEGDDHRIISLRMIILTNSWMYLIQQKIQL
jgi:hypothetical protein